MTVHTIMLPDMMHGREPRSVIWDDEAGTVTGEHSDVPWMQGTLAATPPVVMPDPMGTITLNDPGHDPADFLRVLWDAYWPVMEEPLRSTLPPVFNSVEMTPVKPRAPALDADGNPLPALY